MLALDSLHWLGLLPPEHRMNPPKEKRRYLKCLSAVAQDNLCIFIVLFSSRMHFAKEKSHLKSLSAVDQKQKIAVVQENHTIYSVFSSQMHLAKENLYMSSAIGVTCGEAHQGGLRGTTLQNFEAGANGRGTVMSNGDGPPKNERPYSDEQIYRSVTKKNCTRLLRVWAADITVQTSQSESNLASLPQSI